MRVAVLSFAHLHAAAYIGLLRDRDGIELITADPEAPPGDPTRGRNLAGRLNALIIQKNIAIDVPDFRRLRRINGLCGRASQRYQKREENGFHNLPRGIRVSL